MGYSRHRKWLFGGVLVLCALAGVLVLEATRIRNRVDLKSKLPHENREILAKQIKRVAPEAQLEDNTCGLYTLRAIYRSYSLDPDVENLRNRLGLDVPANPMDSRSTGTLQFDLLRVLVEDGFEYSLINPTGESASKDLLRHVGIGQMAAVLIRRRESGNLHWVAVAGARGRTLKVVDSLETEPYTENTASFLDECAISCILVNPRKSEDHPIAYLKQAEYDGVMEMMTTARRSLALREKTTETANKIVENVPP